MKALRKLKRGVGNMEVVDIKPPVAREHEVIVEVKRAGVCGTDIHVFHDLYPKARPPVTTGHEFSGVVVELGPDVEGWKIGDRVTVDSTASFCGTCQFCRSARTQLCPERLGYGSSKDGGFASFASVHQRALHRLPEHISFQEGAVCEPLACATHAVMEISSIEPGMTVLITGPGTIGLLVLQVVKSMGAKVIITGMEKDEKRLELASRLGADHCVQIGRQDLSSLTSELTGGHGVDLAMECSGTAGGVNDCLSFVGKGGEVVQVGLFGHPAGFNYDEAVLKEVRIRGSFGHNRGTWEKAIKLLEDHRIDLNSLVSGEFPLDQWQEAFRLFETGVGLKYLLYPAED
jgi:L-iditol 2-dehydrogenase